MRLSDLPPGRYQISIACRKCRVGKTAEFTVPPGHFGFDNEIELEDAFNAGRFRCKACREPAIGLEVESIAEVGYARTSLLKLEGWRDAG
jgi:hypothetical protein